jgi:hypothetical protein
MMITLKKQKLKSKGKKLYRSSNGSVYRVPPSRRLARLKQREATQRKLDAKLKA